MHPTQRLVSFDHQLALERIGGDEELLREIAVIFLEEYPAMVEQIRTAVAGNDGETVARAAHKLKGSLGAFSADTGVALARDLETQARQSQWLAIKRIVHDLENELEELHHALAAIVSA